MLNNINKLNDLKQNTVTVKVEKNSYEPLKGFLLVNYVRSCVDRELLH